MILKCTCKSDYQDSKYGFGMRVHNECGTESSRKYRCSVCNTDRGKDEKIVALSEKQQKSSAKAKAQVG